MSKRCKSSNITTGVDLKFTLIVQIVVDIWLLWKSNGKKIGIINLTISRVWFYEILERDKLCVIYDHVSDWSVQ